MGKDYFKIYYKKNKEKIKEQQKVNYYKRKDNTYSVTINKGKFLVVFN